MLYDSNGGDLCDYSKIRFSEKMDPNHSRVLDQKWPDEKTYQAWLAGDKEKLKNLRLIGLHLNLNTQCRWNFILSNNEESKLTCTHKMTKHMLPDTPIRKVEIGYRNDGDNNLQGMRFFDETNMMVLYH